MLDIMGPQGTPLIPGFAEVRIGTIRRFIQITKETPNHVYGWRVDRDGELWSRETKSTIEQNLIVCHRDDIVRRLVLNTFYGLLETAP